MDVANMMGYEKNKKEFKDVVVTVKNNPTIIFSIILLFVWLLAFKQDIISAAAVWSVSDIYSHCFFVLPGAFYLIWEKRSALLRTPVEPNYFAVLILMGLLFLGLLGSAGEIQLVSHFVAFAALPLMIWALFGSKVASVIRFPLCFILFSIPVGGELIPFFQQITAEISMYIISWTNVPVFRDGLYISIPDGRFVVAEACSGVSFFIACFAFGTIYSYLSFQSTKIKVVYILLSLLVPILANGIRVFATILIGHYFGMQYAGDVDHLIFGWLFFAFIMMLLIVIGELIKRFEMAPPQSIEEELYVDKSWEQVTVKSFIAVSMPLVLFFSLTVFSANPVVLAPQLAADKLPGYRSIEINNALWRPLILNATDQFFGFDKALGKGLSAELYVGWFQDNRPGHELITGTHRLFNDDRWSALSSKEIEIDDSLTVNVLHLTSGGGIKRIVFSWYELTNLQSNQRVLVKFQQSLNTIAGVPAGGGVLVLSRSYYGDASEAEESMIQLLRKNYNRYLSMLPFEQDVLSSQERQVD